jgi:hypothetical protein
MATTKFLIPLTTGVKRDVAKTAGIANTVTVTVAVPAGYVGFLFDEASIDLAVIHSGLLVPAMQEMAGLILQNSALVTTLETTKAFTVGCVNNIPKISSAVAVVDDPDVDDIASILQDVSRNVVLVINKPPLTKKTVGLSYAAAGYLAEYVRESLA